MSSTYSTYGRRHVSVEVSIYPSPSMIFIFQVPVFQRFVSGFSEKQKAAAKEQTNASTYVSSPEQVLKR